MQEAPWSARAAVLHGGIAATVEQERFAIRERQVNRLADEYRVRTVLERGRDAAIQVGERPFDDRSARLPGSIRNAFEASLRRIRTGARAGERLLLVAEDVDAEGAPGAENPMRDGVAVHTDEHREGVERARR